MRSYNLSLAIFAACSGLYSCSGDSSATDELPLDAATDTQSEQATIDVGSDADTGADTDSNTCSPPNLLCQGLCVDPKTDLSNCGTCGKVCDSGQVCSAGKCNLVCSGGTEKCSSVCVDTQLDKNNCGTCGNVCDSGQVCSAGKCDIVCSGGTEKCGNACVDTKLDTNNCGTCGHACATDEVCSAGKCDLVCSGGTEKCNNTCVDTKLDKNNCGSCGNACAASEVCSAGKCDLVCSGGTEKCNNICVDTKTDPVHCGSCDMVCPAGESCVASKCELVCTGGTSKCGTVCLNLQSDLKNCGKCGTVCEESAICDAGHCKIPYPTGSFCLPSFPDVPIEGSDWDLQFVVMGDFNQDNLADLVVGGQLALARGNGSFSPFQKISNPVASDKAAVTADFNGDGFLDLAVADTWAHRITVLINNGDLTFSTVGYDVAVKPSAAAVGDLNGDGAIDLVFVTNSGEVLGMMFNAGDGTLLPPKLSATTAPPTSVLVGDFDGDKTTDVIYTVSGGQGGFLHGDGKGAFVTTALFLSGEAPVAKDIDGDGDLDIAAAIFSSVVIAWNDGHGDFSHTTAAPLSSGSSYVYGSKFRLAVEDLDSDGKMDLIATYSEGTALPQPRILWTALNKGNHKFTTKTNYPYSIYNIALGDITGDGTPELIGQNYSALQSSVQVLRNRGDGSFAVPEDHPTNDFATISLLADVTGDKKLDAIGLEGGKPRLFIYPNDGNNGFLDPFVVAMPTPASRVRTGDGNGDGISDLLVIGGTWANFYPGGKTGPGAPISIPWFSSPLGVATPPVYEDIDGDGNRDILCVTSSSDYGVGNALYVLLGNGNGSFQPPKKLNNSPFSNVGAADLNKDGRVDIFGTGQPFSSQVWLSNASGSFTLAYETTAVSWIDHLPVAVDLDGDSVLDLVSAGVVLYGKSDGTYEQVDYWQQFFYHLDVTLEAATVADMNQDGRPDMLVSDRNTHLDVPSVRILFNLGGRKFSKEQRYRGYGPINLIDLNNDGTLDILTSAPGTSKNMRFLLNGCGI